MEKKLYEKQEIYDPAAIAELSEHYAAILRLLGEDPTREGLLKTPERVAKAMAFMTKGYAEDPRDILLSAMFREEYRQMVLVRDIALFLPERGEKDFTPTARELFHRAGKQPDQAGLVGMALFLRRMYDYFFNHLM